MTLAEISRVYMENSRRMREFNRAFALARYAGFTAPHPPLLAGGERYRIPPRPQDKGQNSGPVGKGPDRWGYYSVNEPDSHAAGDFFSDPGGGVYCKVETPAPGGGWEPRWLRVT